MSKMKALFIAGVALVIAETAASAAPKLSPANWPAEERAAAEKAESTGMMPAESKVYVGRKGAISATASAVSVAAGLQTLDHGGNAADAATAIAMTGITMQLGTVVSYAGIMSLVYYDAKTKKVYSLDAGYNSYRGETDPESIPAADMGSVAAAARTGTAGGSNIGTAPAAAKTDFGRMTLVAGYMMGFEAMQKRFGRLAWADLFAPAIWYAQKGVVVNPSLFAFFDWRKSFLERTPEGKAFLHPGDAALPGIGERFYQPETAKTLRIRADRFARRRQGDQGRPRRLSAGLGRAIFHHLRRHHDLRAWRRKLGGLQHYTFDQRRRSPEARSTAAFLGRPGYVRRGFAGCRGDGNRAYPYPYGQCCTG